MTTFDQFTTTANQLLTQENTPPLELRKILLDADDLIHSDEYQQLAEDQRLQVQNLRKELKNRIQQMELGTSADLVLEVPPDVVKQSQPPPEPDALPVRQSTPPEPASSPTPGYDPAAEAHMEEAEKLFYSGRYSEAVRLFDRVLHLEPKWERARQHRLESENYLRTGYIPPVALPSEAASAFGKAQSASRVGRYEDALALLQKAHASMRQAGIQRWQEGLDFEQKLQENIDAEKVYVEGGQLFAEGRIDEAIERVEAAARATGLPKFRDRAQSYRRVRDKMRQIHESLSSLSADPKVIGQAKVDLDLMLSEFGANPMLERLASRLQSVIPRAIAPLKEQVRTYKAKSERADTLVDAISYAQQARNSVDQIRQLSDLDEGLERLQDEIDRSLQELNKLESDLSSARTAYQNHPSWPSSAYKTSLEVRARFPQDPQVQQLNRSLAGFKAMRLAAFGLGAIVIIMLLFFLGSLGMDRYRLYQLAQTPSPTSTATRTPTATFTPTATATATSTVTPTATFTPTATPINGFALRDIWARNGCYETFTATGRIPLGGEVVFLTSERRFDQFNRECALVEHNAFGRSIIGWILLMDLSPIDVTPAP